MRYGPAESDRERKFCTMKIDIVAAALPPKLDGIGDYTSHIAVELARSARIRILTTEGLQYTPIGGVDIVPVFQTAQPKSVVQILQYVERERPDWLLLQYNPFGYGRWGLNLYLPEMMRNLKRRSPGTRFAFMAHENFVPLINWKFAVMTTWQRWQFWRLGRSADTIFVSTEPWTRRFKTWFPGKPMIHLPVGSNISCLQVSYEQARAELGIEADKLVIGLFGTAHPSRMLWLIRDAVQAAEQAGFNVLVLYVGPDGATVRESLPDLPVRTDGPLPSVEVSRRFAAMDVYLAPFVDGVSTRRGSFLTGIQHGVPTLGTESFGTDTALRKANGSAFLLADVQEPERFKAHLRNLLTDRSLRERLGKAGKQFYDQEFAWGTIAAKLLAALH